MQQECWFCPAALIHMCIWKCLLWERFSSDTYETGTRAALYGGTTTVIDFILQKQGNSLRAAFDEWSGRATGNAVGDYSFHMAVTDFNDNTKKEIKEMIDRRHYFFQNFYGL